MAPHVSAGRVIMFFSVFTMVLVLAITFAAAWPLFVGSDSPLMLWVLIPGTLFLLLQFFFIYLGGAVKRHEDWARIGGIVYGALLLPGFPIGTIAGGYVIWVLATKWND